MPKAIEKDEDTTSEDEPSGGVQRFHRLDRDDFFLWQDVNICKVWEVFHLRPLCLQLRLVRLSEDLSKYS